MDLIPLSQSKVATAMMVSTIWSPLSSFLLNAAQNDIFFLPQHYVVLFLGFGMGFLLNASQNNIFFLPQHYVVLFLGFGMKEKESACNSDLLECNELKNTSL